jgi:hypothetical protein
VVLSARLVSLPVASMLALLMLLLVLAAGCGDDDGGAAGALSGAGAGAAAGGDDAGPDAYDAGATCPDWTHDVTYGETGLLADAEGDTDVAVRLMHASNVPPRKGFNTWDIELQSADGERLDDYQVTWICSFMPAHNHPAGPDLMAGAEAGQFTIDRLNLGMNGGWEIPLWVDPIDAGKPAYTRMSVDDACKPVGDPSRPPDLVFRVCVPRR